MQRSVKGKSVKRKLLSAVLGIVVVCSLSVVQAAGKPTGTGKDYFGHFALGALLPQGDFGDLTEDDFYMDGGFTYWPDDWALGLGLDLAYTSTDLNREVVNRINEELAGMGAGSITGGDVTIWSLSANGYWGPDTSGKIGFYVTAGVGFDYLEGQIKDNGLIYYPPICDPWFWWCIPGGVGTGTIVVLEEDTFEFA